jgi:hypothetical protein
LLLLAIASINDAMIKDITVFFLVGINLVMAYSLITAMTG